MTRITPPWLTADATRTVMAALADARPHFVGGCVRDALMGRDGGDIDIAVTTPPETTLTLAAAAGLKAVPTGLDHGVVTIIAHGAPFEIATLRRDVATDGRRAVVAFTTHIDDDARRRDFTMNALYADAEGAVIDPLGEGLADLAARRLRFIGDARQRIREDYLRILRFFRFHAQFGLAPMDADGLAACLAEQDGLAAISAERIGAEMKKLLAAPDPGPALAAMGPILDQILPGAAWRCDLLAAEDALRLPPSPLRRLAALGARSCDRLRLSNAESAHLERVRAARRLPLGEAAYRFGAAIAWDAAAIEFSGRAPDPGAAQAIDAGAAAVFPITARDLMDRGLTPGPDLGAALKMAEQRWIDSGFSASRDSLLAGVGS